MQLENSDNRLSTSNNLFFGCRVATSHVQDDDGAVYFGVVFFQQVALVDIRGRVNKEREEGSDFFSTTYEGLNADYLDAHIPGAVFVDWTKVRKSGRFK